MASATEQIRCPGCGSQVVADLAGEQIQCPHCGRRELLASKGQVEELDLESLLKLEEDKAGEPLAEFSLVCQSCGAKTAHPAHIKVLECPFCASNVIRDEKDQGSPFQPVGILPFQCTPEEASVLIRGWSRRLWFRPKAVQQLSRLDEFLPIYVPFWTLDCGVKVNFQGRIRGHKEVTEETGFFIFRSQKKRDWHYDEAVDSFRRAKYDDFLVSASHGLPAEHLDELKPFSTHSLLVPYSPKFLAGLAAEEAQIGPKGAWQRAEEQLRLREYRKAVENVRRDPADDIDLQVSYEFAQRQGKPVLLPVFVAAYRHGGKVYRVLVNGETGRVSGEAPYSLWKLGMLAALLLPFVVGTIVASAGSSMFFYALLALLYQGDRWRKDAQRQDRAVHKASSVYIKKPPVVKASSRDSGGSPPGRSDGYVPRWKRHRLKK